MTASGQATLPASPPESGLARLLAASPVAARLLARWPELADMALPAAPSTETWRVWAAAALAGAPDGVEALRVARRRALFAVMVRAATTGDWLAAGRELAELGAACISVALQLATAELRPRFGLPRRRDGGLCRLVVIGLGGLGGSACDFSGKVDVVFVHETDRGQTDGGENHGERLELHVYFTRLCQRITAIVQSLDEDLAPFRVGLDLRPEGRFGSLCNSMDALESYLETFGSPADRVAWMRARPVAGDLDLGAEVLETVRPFVFRRLLANALVDEIAALKSRVEALGGRIDGDGSFDIQWDDGGLTALTFAVQMMQLAWGGRLPTLRTPDIASALTELGAHGLRETPEVAALEAAWRFLNSALLALQLVGDSTSPRLALGGPEANGVAALLGLTTTALQAALGVHRAEVARVFGSLATTDTSLRAPTSTYALLLEPDAAPTARAEAARILGFQQPEATLRCLDVLLRRPQSPFHLRARADGGPVAALADRVLEACLASPSPDEALRHFDAFFRVIEHRRQALAQLHDDPKRLKAVATVFGTSHLLSRLLVRSPGLIDRLVLEGREPASRDRRALEALLAEEIALHGDDTEGTLGAVRRLFAAETLRIGFQDLAGIIDIHEVMAQLSLLAEVIVAAVCAAARRDLEVRFDCNLDGFGVVAGGRLGGRELGYRGELDLMFIHDASIEPQLASRLARAIITGLSCATPEGVLYDIDTHQRPSGNQGPLCIGAARLLAHHTSALGTWERQAALRMRVIVGTPGIAALVADLRRQAFGALATDPRRARQEVFGSLEPRSHGTSLAVETRLDTVGANAVTLLVQYLQLILPEALAGRAGGGHSAGSPATLNALTGLGELEAPGFPSGQGAQLAATWSFFRRIENRLTIANERIDEAFAALGAADESVVIKPSDMLCRVALRLGYGVSDGDKVDAARRLVADYRGHRNALARAIVQVLDGAAKP